MTALMLRNKRVRTIAALHLPPMPAASRPEAWSLTEVVGYALRNAQVAFDNGLDALYLQDLGDHPVARSSPEQTIARIAVIGREIRRAYPGAVLGVCLMAHGARAPLAAAQAMEADFVRLKVYVGTMVKAEGLVEGCAHEAVEYRAAIRAEDVRLLTDIYDRTGVPLAPLPLSEAVRQAVTYGRSDGIILTGADLDGTARMLAEVNQSNLGVPLIIGGGVTTSTVADALALADAVIVSTALKKIPSWSAEALESDWDPEQVRAFVAAAGARQGQN